MTARRTGPPSWGSWRLEPLDLRLVNEATGAAVDLGVLRDCRALWRLTCEALDGSSPDGHNLVRALVALFPPPAVVGRPGQLSVPDVVGLVVGTCLHARSVWHPGEALIQAARTRRT